MRRERGHEQAGGQGDPGTEDKQWQQVFWPL
jgi:hypothetical protein